MKQYLDRTLAEDEFLLKILPAGIRRSYSQGFLTKLNQDGSIPVKFLGWAERDASSYVIVNEVFKEGWKIQDARFGESQNWAVLMHPDGYSLEIYMKNFLEILKTTTVVNGELQGKFKWSYSKLLKE